MEKPAREAFTALRRLQAIPVPQLTPEQRITLHDALAAIRSASCIPFHLSFPETVWSLMDEQQPSLHLDALFARRLIAQNHIHRLSTRSFVCKLLDILCTVCRDKKSQIGRWLLYSEFYKWYLKSLILLPQSLHPGYRGYALYRARDDGCAPSMELLSQSSERFSHRPRISVVMPVHDPRFAWLKEGVLSVMGQVYDQWQLCICANRLTKTSCMNWLFSLPAADDRIRVVGVDAPTDIATSMNLAAEQATGEFVAFLDQDDVLAPSALFYVVQALQGAQVDIVYTDEDFINASGARIRPHFKPDWSPTLLDSCMYMGHLVVIRRSLFLALGGFRANVRGAQDYDLLLRATELTENICHIPKVLYHWRMHSSSVAASVQNKSYTHSNGLAAIESSLARRGCKDAAVTTGKISNLYYRNHRESQTQPVDIVLMDQDQLCVCALGRDFAQVTEFSGARFVVPVDSVAALERTDYSAHAERVCMFVGGGTDSAAELANKAFKSCSRDIVIFLDMRLKALQPRWVEFVIGHFLLNSDVGIVGSMVVRSSGVIEHAGIVLGLVDGIGRVGRGSRGSCYWPWVDAPRDVTAVGVECLAVRRGVFTALGGFEPSMAPYYHGVDLCLRTRELGYSVVLEPRSIFCCDKDELAPSLTPTAHWERFLRRWGSQLAGPDIHYSPNLRLDSETDLL